ncbi:unnamed protein product [Lepeophtheirus salmonis]|uniref:(salmon louse) hypothetical protein n=1 Tax=Lepeophtheirus salmonis TaxID=72036 RepID=A0A817FCL2_LEPSM|nr:unnamed protein product [Lepeophtheirus salmonis]
MCSKVILIFALVACAYGDQPPAGYGAPAPAPAPPPPPPPPAPIPPYAYNYAVLDAESGNDFSAEEEAKHGAVTGDSGFVADVVTELPPPPPPAYGAPPAPLPSYV